MLVYSSLRKAGIKKKIFQNPVMIHISFNDKLDIDNHGYISKLIVDGMKGYLIADDTRRYVKRLVQDFHDSGGIIVEIREVT